MSFRCLFALAIICSANQAHAQYSLQVSQWPTTAVIANVPVPKPIPAAKVHRSLLDQRGRMDRQRWIEAADRQAARKKLANGASVIGAWDVLSSSGHSKLELSRSGYTVDDAMHRDQGVWQREHRAQGFLLTLHALGKSPATFASTWTVPGHQFKMVHQVTGATYTATRR